MPNFKRSALLVVLATAVGATAGCSATDIVGEPTPSAGGSSSANGVKSPDGAIEFYHGALALASLATQTVTIDGGLLTDELRPALIVVASGGSSGPTPIDGRTLPDVDDGGLQIQSFNRLQITRANARQGRALLAEYAPAAPTALTGRLYAVEAYADAWLADLYCSGIPLSTVNGDGTFTLAAGSTTEQVYRAALALFDSAQALSADSVRFLDLARVGAARVHLALGEYTEAAAAVADVPDTFVYSVPARFGIIGEAYSTANGQVIVSDAEGRNGLPFASGRDPRSAVDTLVTTTPSIFPRYVAEKYPGDVDLSLVVASGIEARLIEAEVDARAGRASWLATLNRLRTTGAFTGFDTTLVIDTTHPGGVETIDTTVRVDTLWSPGVGGFAGLGPLRDPGTLAGRLDIVFRERAYWLFITGQRQADLRRRVRNDHIPAQQLYPTGVYPSGGVYGTDVNFPVPFAERAGNPNYTGCINRDA